MEEWNTRPLTGKRKIRSLEVVGEIKRGANVTVDADIADKKSPVMRALIVDHDTNTELSPCMHTQSATYTYPVISHLQYSRYSAGVASYGALGHVLQFQFLDFQLFNSWDYFTAAKILTFDFTWSLGSMSRMRHVPPQPPTAV